MTETSFKREWLPDSWLDEITPELALTPEAFVERVGDGWLLRPVDEGNRDVVYFRTYLEPGQVVGFVYREFYGAFTVRVKEDRTWSVPVDWPEKATHFWRDGEIFESMEEAVNPDGDWQGDRLEPGEHDVDVGFWSSSISFRFDVDHDGQPKFTQVAGAN